MVVSRYFLLIWSIWLFSCAHQPSVTIPQKARIWVLPFKNLTSYPRAEHIVAEIMTTELGIREDFVVLDTTQSFSTLKEKKRNPAQDIQNARYKDIAKLLNVSYFLTGTITEYRYTRGIAEVPTVAIVVKLIDGKTGKDIWRAAQSDISTESFFKRSASLNELTHKVCATLVSNIKTP